MVKNLDLLVIDNYDDNFESIPSVKKVLDETPPPYDFKCDFQIAMRKKNQKLNTRAGSAPNRLGEENKFRPQSPCILPFTQMIVRPDGTVAKCCNDPLNKMTLGDLNRQTLREIWRGRAYQELRKEMFFNGRQNIPGCEFCDIFGLYNYLPPHAKTNEFKRLVNERGLVTLPDKHSLWMMVSGHFWDKKRGQEFESDKLRNTHAPKENDQTIAYLVDMLDPDVSMDEVRERIQNQR